MYYLAQSMTELCHNRFDRDVNWEGIPVDNGAGKECVLVIVFGNDVFSKHLFPMVSYTQNTHKIPIPSNPRSTLLPSPLTRPLQPV